MRKTITNAYLNIIHQKDEYSVPVYHTKLELASLAIDVVKYFLLALTYISNTSLVWIPALISIIFKSIVFYRVKDKFQSTYCNPLNILLDFMILVVGLNAGSRSSTLGMGWIITYFFILTFFLIWIALVFFGLFTGKLLHLVTIGMSFLFFIISWSASIFLDASSENSSISNSKLFAFLLVHLLLIGSVFALFLVIFGEDRIFGRLPKKQEMTRIPDTARSTGRVDTTQNDVMITMGDESHRERHYSAEKKWSIPIKTESKQIEDESFDVSPSKHDDEEWSGSPVKLEPTEEIVENENQRTNKNPIREIVTTKRKTDDHNSEDTKEKKNKFEPIENPDVPLEPIEEINPSDSDKNTEKSPIAPVKIIDKKMPTQGNAI